MNILCLIISAITLLYQPCYGQNDFVSWDKKYVLKSYKQLIAEEKAYAIKVGKEEKKPHDYSRFDTYRMSGKFTGKSRPIDSRVMQSMKVVCFSWGRALPKPESLNSLVSSEFLFSVEGIEVWMPIQKILEKPLREEIEIGESVMLYCVFLNDKRLNQPLYNTLLVSEFRSSTNK